MKRSIELADYLMGFVAASGLALIVWLLIGCAKPTPPKLNLADPEGVYVSTHHCEFLRHVDGETRVNYAGVLIRTDGYSV